MIITIDNHVILTKKEYERLMSLLTSANYVKWMESNSKEAQDRQDYVDKLIKGTWETWEEKIFND